MNLGDMAEPEFKIKLIEDLGKRGINAVDLGETGTFDLIIEGQRPYVVELKKVTPDYSTHMQQKGFDFRRSQHREIEKMKFPPLVIGFDDKGCYWFEPERVKTEVTERHEYYESGQAARFRTPYFEEFSNPLTYEDFLKKLVRFIKRTINNSRASPAAPTVPEGRKGSSWWKN